MRKLLWRLHWLFRLLLGQRLCEHSDHRDGKCCHRVGDRYEYFPMMAGEPEEPVFYCTDHAGDGGFCRCCGNFCSGITSFDMNPAGLCSECDHELAVDTGKFDENEEGPEWDFMH